MCKDDEQVGDRCLATDESDEGMLICMLDLGHAGPHKWTPDDEVELCLA